MRRRGLDAVVVGQPYHVYYLSAFSPQWQHQAACVLFADGRSVLISANEPARAAAVDEAAAYEANWHGTLRQEQPAEVARLALAALSGRHARRIGIDASPVTALVLMGLGGSCESIDADLWQLRRPKDADELELMKKGDPLHRGDVPPGEGDHRAGRGGADGVRGAERRRGDGRPGSR